jgi:DnaJ-class molecular chaperone
MRQKCFSCSSAFEAPAEALTLPRPPRRGLIQCTACDCKGQVYDIGHGLHNKMNYTPSFSDVKPTTCQWCNGTGFITCPVCHGTGYIDE